MEQGAIQSFFAGSADLEIMKLGIVVKLGTIFTPLDSGKVWKKFLHFYDVSILNKYMITPEKGSKNWGLLIFHKKTF